MPKKRETKVKVGAVTFKVRWIDNPTLDDKDVTAYIDYNNQTICIKSGLSPQIDWLTIWHEIIHGMLYNEGYEKHDEAMVTSLAHGICQVLAENTIMHRPRRTMK